MGLVFYHFSINKSNLSASHNGVRRYVATAIIARGRGEIISLPHSVQRTRLSSNLQEIADRQSPAIVVLCRLATNDLFLIYILFALIHSLRLYLRFPESVNKRPQILCRP